MSRETQVDRQKLNISVRSLVEFILRSGHIDNRKVGRSSVDAMQEGSRIHRKIQKKMGPNYTAEVPLSINAITSKEGVDFDILVEGRCDGIITNEEEKQNIPSIIIDEIKGIYMDLQYLKEPIQEHKAQAMCYAYIYGSQEELEEIGIRLTYCNLETEAIKYFDETFQVSQLKEWFNNLIDEYGKWAYWKYKWSVVRDNSIKKLTFPFEYRQGQKKLTRDVYLSIIRDKRLFIEAPTGVGKTISTVYPSIMAIGERKASKIFYLTAKTITRTVAQETVDILRKQKLSLISVIITAKEKICILDKPDCNPMACERAKGHYDRVNDCLFELINNEDAITREVIQDYAERYKVCPFEMCLDVSLWADFVICDYNYAFDPNVYLRRFFSEKKQDYIFLIDEAHNLVDRACNMYSASLNKEDFLKVRRLVGKKANKLYKSLSKCNKDLLDWKRQWEKNTLVDDISGFVIHLINLGSIFAEFLEQNQDIDEKDEVLQLYFDVLHFISMYEGLNDKYLIYLDYSEELDLTIKLLCVDPSDNLKSYLDKVKSSVFFSATLLPIKYYREQLGGREEDYAIYAPSPFPSENKLILVGDEVSTRYSRRNEEEYLKILDYIKTFTAGKIGNYLVFFSSYKMLYDIAELAADTLPGLFLQTSNMNETEREDFLAEFETNPRSTKIGFCVLGGIFGEGIDLKADRLIGAVIVGPGLPMKDSERELLRKYYEKKGSKGFEYAYLYQGMNKVLQAGGRVIRTMEDKGAILLLDDRFLQGQYEKLFPREWFPYKVAKREKLKGILEKFWCVLNETSP